MAATSKHEDAARQIRLVTCLGAAVNIVLALVKIAIGMAVSSLAMIADAIHSLSDLATDVAVVIGSYWGGKKPDLMHPYGHGRIETFCAVFVALTLMGVGGFMVYQGALSIARSQTTAPHWGILAGAMLSIVAKEWLYRVTKKAARRLHSPVVYANAWHHRSDAFSSVAVLVGFLAMVAGYDHGDQVAAIAVGLMIVFVGVKVVVDAVMELTEAAVDPETLEHVKSIMGADPAIRQWHRLRTRTVGREVFLDVHILVDPELNIAAAHDVSERLEKALDEEISRPVNITVHVEPDLPSFRKQSLPMDGGPTPLR
ncbi:MAG TPA: cation diffusion facilitator family transporter [Sedimentisphaerales bacterium]|jgi:cation diffusion facilitator family transporter|nr:cation diffusion facilitator family transporter [Sedimentisphaerales bacterium]HNU29987.1 cation diffusion facilitator family transporter [Sedimentisphaerales bacterium]